MNESVAHEPEYIAARRVLLDALEALGTHRKAVVLVGAQAIYLRVGDEDMAVAPFTTDGDLAVNPDLLDDEPMLAEALRAAGFDLAVRPGTWSRTEVQIDLLVPSSMGGAGRRSARLGIHGNEVARKARGLEAALFDRSTIRIVALEPDDLRSFDVDVAGLASLLVAKLFKIAEREATPERWMPKDGLDVLRILRSADLQDVGATLRGLEGHAVAGTVTREARTYLERLFASRTGHGAAMAVRASAGLENAATIAVSCEALARQLLAEWKHGPVDHGAA